MSREQAEAETYADLTLKMSAYMYQDAKQWEHTRAIITAIYNVNRKPKSPAVKPHRIMPLPTDPVRKASFGDVGAAFNALLKHAKKGKNG